MSLSLVTDKLLTRLLHAACITLVTCVLVACSTDNSVGITTGDDTAVDDDAGATNPDGSPVGAQDAVVTQIRFAAPTEPNLVIAGVPGPEQSQLTITATGENGNPVPAADVVFSIYSGAASGATLIGADIDGEVSLETNDTGNATIKLESGSAPTVLQVQAKSQNITELSGHITISTGVPVQNRLSLALDTFNPENACCEDGVVVEATIRSTDQLGRAVPDGTVFQAIASESGLIPNPGSSCATEGGSCSIVWESSGPSPADGTVNIVFYTNGAEQFDDFNNDGLFNFNPSDGDTHVLAYDVPEPFEDYNDDGVFTPGIDEFVDINTNNGIWDSAADDGWTENTIIWTDATFVISTRSPEIFDCDLTNQPVVDAPSGSVNSDTCGAIPAGSQTFQVAVSDSNNNSLTENSDIEWVLKSDAPAEWKLEGVDGLSRTVGNTSTGPNASTAVTFNPGATAGTGTIELLVKISGVDLKQKIGTWTVTN